ncbi:MAG: hypothetical protein F6K14_28380 [Symploca sp. SIO2C1]|nr:hypothetical protein [Symploca sp. SIO2C1]
MKILLKSSFVSILALSLVWLSSGLFGVSAKDFVPWLQVVGFSAMAANQGLQIAQQLDDEDEH